MDLAFLVWAGFAALEDYLLAHTLFCLVPAFFIAGAMSALVPKESLLQYLGKDSPKIIAYPIAVLSGLLLAVCSCTVLPLFAGIRKGGAGIGPAVAFMYTAPATNILAILYTGSLIGWDLALARIAFSVVFAVALGLALSSLFKDDVQGLEIVAFKKKKASSNQRRLVALFGLLVAILLVGTRIGEEWLKYGLTAVLVCAVGFVALKYFSKDALQSWMDETFSFTKTIFPLLLVGVFVSGIVRVLLPKDAVSVLVGSNDVFAMVIPVLFGILVYFPTLVEVPMAKTFLELGMSKGALLAYLLADPVLSLPSILVVRRLLGNARTAFYVGAIFLLSVAAGLIFGRIAS